MPALPLMVEVLARVQQMPPLSRQERGLHFLRLTERLGSCSSSLRPHLRVNGARTTPLSSRETEPLLFEGMDVSFHGYWHEKNHHLKYRKENQMVIKALAIFNGRAYMWINILALSHWKQWQPVIACNSRGPVETIKHGVTEFSAIPPGILAGYVQACHCS
ncbi:uncharacterized protein LOC103714574 isoform X2 [Phoenix dactylifera]|uniref:Uncharacterized protein LOC103714574 isoform X2 n=1 Tax=Phoenix dactylifera TaxID=42345 RepID=A0A8B8J8H6_PHODC|nr:uncharacterized protein LOC103714574 isoform X2 [Phoenix dactylifera]